MISLKDKIAWCLNLKYNEDRVDRSGPFPKFCRINDPISMDFECPKSLTLLDRPVEKYAQRMKKQEI